MRVVYSNGAEGNLSSEEAVNLYTEGRLTAESWQELENLMIRLDIDKFEDSFLSKLGIDFCTINYVRNQVIVSARRAH